MGDFMRTCVRADGTESAREACRAQAKAMYENATAGEADMSSGAKGTFFEKFQRDAARERSKDRVRECLSDDNKTRQEVRDCMQAARATLRSELGGYMKRGKSQADRTKRTEELRKEAARDVLGDIFNRCAQAGLDKEACKRRLRKRKEDAGLSDEDDEGIVKYRFGKMLRKPSEEDCSTDWKECRRQAKAEAIGKGMRRREYAAVRLLGAVRAAAEVWAGCREAEGEDAACEGLAQDEFIRVTGSRPVDFSAMLKRKVMRLGQAITDGKEIKVVKFKRMLVSGITDGIDCNATLEDLFAAQALNISKANNRRVTRAVKRACRLMDARPEYSALVFADIPDVDFGVLAEATAAGLMGSGLDRRLEEEDLRGEVDDSGRRLDSVSETFAAQDVAECASSDAACASGSTTESIAGSPTPVQAGSAAPAPGPDTSGSRRSALAAACSATAVGAYLLLP